MNLKFVRFFPLLAVLALSGCVTSRTPVGDKVATLDPKVWNAKWRDGDGQVYRTKIKDLKLGIVEMKQVWPMQKAKPGEPSGIDLLMRTLGGELIANTKEDNEYDFERVSIDAQYFVAYMPDENVFAALIRRHKIAGTIEKSKNARFTDSCTVDGLSERQYERFAEEGFDVRSLFSEDPVTVLVRDHGFW